MPYAAARTATRDEDAGRYQPPARANPSLSDRRSVLPERKGTDLFFGELVVA